MPSLSIASLLVPPTRQTVETQILTLLAAAGFPTTSWQTTSVPRALVGAFAAVYVVIATYVCQIAAAGFLSTSSGDFLTVLANEVYAVSRLTGAYTTGNVLISSSASAPTTTIPAGSYVVVSNNGYVYRNTAAITVAPSSINVPLAVQAEAIGAAYNTSGGALSAGTPLPGITMTAAPGLAWIVEGGVDVETDASLVSRCRAKWSTLGIGGSANYYIFYARAASTNVVRVRVDKAFPYPGQVSLVLAGQTGTVSPTDVATVLANVEPPLCVQLNAAAARLYTVTLRGPVTVKAAQLAAAQSALTTAITNYEGAVNPGDTITLSELIAMVATLPGVTNFVPKRADGSNAVPGVDDFTLDRDQIVSLVASLTWMPV